MVYIFFARSDPSEFITRLVNWTKRFPNAGLGCQIPWPGVANMSGKIWPGLLRY